VVVSGAWVVEGRARLRGLERPVLWSKRGGGLWGLRLWRSLVFTSFGFGGRERGLSTGGEFGCWDIEGVGDGNEFI